jgi:hypothetical protein
MDKLSAIQMKEKLHKKCIRPTKNDEFGYIKNIQLLPLEKYYEENEKTKQKITTVPTSNKRFVSKLYIELLQFYN